MLRRLSIRSKLLLLIALPIAGLVALAGVAAMDAANEAADTASTRDEIAATVDVTFLLHELQRERDLASIAVSVGDDLTADDFARQVGRVGGLTAEMQRSIARLPADRQPLFEDALAALADLDEYRDRVLAGEVGASDVAGTYGTALTTLLAANAEIARSTPDISLRGSLEGAVALARAKDAYAMQRGLVSRVLTEGSWTPEELADATRLAALEDAQLEIFRETADPEAVERFEARVEGRAAEPADETLERVLATTPGAAFEDEPDDWFRRSSTRLDLVKDIEDLVAEDVVAAASARHDEAQATQMRVLAIALAAIASIVALTTLIARSISTPIRRLTERATRAADRDLPDYVAAAAVGQSATVPPALSTRSGSEIGDVVHAFNRLQSTAVRLTDEQVELRARTNEVFIDLGRRNQAMLGRQLRAIERLESVEEDPDVLAELFGIDHLTTRMRRNAESLLVLAGATDLGSPGAPVPLEDTLRIAIGEVEDYQRVEVEDPPHVSITPLAARDVAHLLAELIENATACSPPTTTVQVGLRGHRGGCTITIVDRGLGLDPLNLAESNERLRGGGVLDGRALGLTVVSRLARRHGITVRLSSSLGKGTTARVELPRAVLATDATRAPAPEPVDEPHTPPVIVIVESAGPRGEPGVENAEEPPTPATPEIEASGLPKRTRKRSVAAPEVFDLGLAPTRSTTERRPEEIGRRLASFQDGLERGRADTPPKEPVA